MVQSIYGSPINTGTVAASKRRKKNSVRFQKPLVAGKKKWKLP